MVDIEAMPKSGSKSQDQRAKEFGKCFKLMQGLVVTTMFTYEHQAFVRMFFPKDPQVEEEQKESGKKKSHVNPSDKIAMMNKYVEFLNLKVFEEKQEKSEDVKWAKSLFEPLVHNALPATNNKKVFDNLDYKQSHLFYTKMYKQIKVLLSTARAIKTLTYSPTDFLHVLDSFMSEKPCGFTRLLYEKTMFPDNYQDEHSARELNPKEYIFLSSNEF